MNPLFFPNALAFEQWLSLHHNQNEGVFLLFDKTHQTSSFTPEEALAIALCYGWIDGLIKKVDHQYYQKYFKKRASRSIWSSRNKQLAEQLVQSGRMKEAGLDAMKKAKQDGRWQQAVHPPKDYHLGTFHTLLVPYPQAYSTFLSMSPSVQKTYALSYFSLKKEDSRKRRLLVIIERLHQGLNPME